MVGMAQALERHGRPFRLLYAGRTRDQMPFVDDLRELLGERLELFVSADGTRLDVGREIDRLDPDGEAYLCGPLRLRDACSKPGRLEIDQPAGCNSRPSPLEGASRPRSSSSASPTNRITKSASDATVPCSAPSKTTGWT
jgi:ferredoxin-NADP reductase